MCGGGGGRGGGISCPNEVLTCASALLVQVHSGSAKATREL